MSDDVAIGRVGPVPDARRLKLTPLEIYRATPIDRMLTIKEGLPAIEAKRFLADLTIQQATVLRALALPTATVNKKVKLRAKLSPADSERVVGLAKLVGQVEAMVQESGDPAGFDAAGWMSRWLQEPQPAPGGGRRTADGGRRTAH